jgi:hypothetical protein
MSELCRITDRETLERQVRRSVADTPVVDLHTHLYDAGFGDREKSSRIWPRNIAHA